MEVFSVILGIIVMLVIIAYVSSQIRKNQMNEESKENEKSEDDALFEGIDFDVMTPEEAIPLEVYDIDENESSDEEPIFEEQQALAQEPQTEAASIKQVFIKEAETCDKQKYEKVLSTKNKREWIENFVNIKRFVAAGWICMGLAL